jgi:hypothetical protein
MIGSVTKCCLSPNGPGGIVKPAACHGTGCAFSRHAAPKHWSGRKIVDHPASRRILIRSPSTHGVGEEAPGACKNVGAIVAAAEHGGLTRRVAPRRPFDLHQRLSKRCGHSPGFDCQHASSYSAIDAKVIGS